jgi:EXLDI family protein
MRWTIVRDGQPDLRFVGEKVGEASNRSYQGSRQNRWTEIAIYQTKDGRYVVSVKHRSQWEGESDHASAVVAGSPLALLGALDDPAVIELAKEVLAAGDIDAAEDLDEGGES